ncbi:hypothetical protein PFLUV_G00155770 [Perca fluviatilis]|uniref:Uncharacterized protein n=1 Tax=Perca fluviatilis TaxID=8168 RepID=A0A6A5F304_PERFL|nr:hypothetical protein PFLUV_G00155770 [Perca fluviatilis]
MASAVENDSPAEDIINIIDALQAARHTIATSHIKNKKSTKSNFKDYELNFGLWEKHVDNSWHGGVATIKSCPGAEVWGVIWIMSNENLPSLDNQEGVSQGKYSPLEVSVETENGLMLCRSYQMNNFHACPPSPQYKQVVCLGAEQNGLPGDYLKRLKAIQTNNYTGPSILDQIQTVK